MKFIELFCLKEKLWRETHLGGNPKYPTTANPGTWQLPVYLGCLLVFLHGDFGSYSGKRQEACPLLRRMCGFSLGYLSCNHWWMILLYPWERGTFGQPDVVVPSKLTCSWIFELKRGELEGAGGQDIDDMLVSCRTLRNAEHLVEITGL